MAELKVEASSPDDSVRIRLDRQRGIRMRIAPPALERHNETSIARQIEMALRVAMKEYRSQVDEILAVTGASGEAPHPDTPIAKRLSLMDKAIETVRVKTRSEEGYVSLEWKGEKDFTVIIGRGALGVIGAEQLAHEMNSALAAANRERVPRLIHARRTALRAANELR